MWGHVAMLANLVLSLALPCGLYSHEVSAEEGGDPSANLPPLIVLDFSLKGDVEGIDLNAEHKQRLAMASEKLRDELEGNQLFKIIDPCAADPGEQPRTYEDPQGNTNCEPGIALPETTHVLEPWVFRLSALVLTLHIVIKDAETGHIVSRKAVDFRGDNDIGWSRAIDALIRDMKHSM